MNRCTSLALSAFLTWSLSTWVLSQDCDRDFLLVTNPGLSATLDGSFLTTLEAPGATAAVLLPDLGLWKAARGFTSSAQIEPMSPDDHFWILSLTKTFVATFVLHLDEEGILAIDDPLEEWVPGYFDGKGITLRHLLGHTSGIVDYWPCVSDLLKEGPLDFVTLSEIAAECVAASPLRFTPGSQFEYCNMNYIFLGMVIEKATEQSWHVPLREFILDPLELCHTHLLGVEVSRDYIVGGVSPGYNFCGLPDGGLASNVSDIVRFIHALFGGQLIDQEHLQQMTTPSTPGGMYGLGMGIAEDPDGNTVYYNWGVGWGHSGALMYFPETGMCFSALRNISRASMDWAWSLPFGFATAVRDYCGTYVCSEKQFIVDPTGAGNFTAIQPAIDAAADGDTVLVKAGVYLITTPITFKGKAISVESVSGPVQTTIRLTGNLESPERARVIIFESGETEESVLRGFTLEGIRWAGWEGENAGGGIACINGSSPVLANCRIIGNSAHSGGGLYCIENSSPKLTDCEITGNAAREGGGVYCSSSPEFDNCTITGNWATGNGGGVSCGGSPQFANCTISGNTAGYGGGVYCSPFSFPALTNCTIAGNAADDGGGVSCWGLSEPVLTSCIVWSNAGGSIQRGSKFSNPAVSFSCIEGDEGAEGEGNLDTDPLFCGWDGDDVQVRNQGELKTALGGFRFSLSTQSPCIGKGKDGSDMGTDAGTCAEGGESTRLIRLSEGIYYLGGLNLASNVSIEGSGGEKTVIKGTVRGLRTGASLSHATITEGTSGGVRIGRGESPEISCCAITGNSAEMRGGGISCSWFSSPTMNNCIISGNSAEAGGGVFCNGASSPRFTNCTISGNSAGGVLCHTASAEITNCIVWGNLMNPAIVSSTLQISFSCIEGEDVWPGEGNINTDPLRVNEGDFDFNRWKMVTIGEQEYKVPDFIVDPGNYRLQAGSPCIDTGTDMEDLSTDIEGNSRPCGEALDMGAYEFCPSWIPELFLRGDVDGNGTLNLTDVINFLNHRFVGKGNLDCLDSADVNDDGVLDLTDAVRSLNYQFTGTAPAPEPPGQFECGPDPTVDELTCDSHPACSEER